VLAACEHVQAEMAVFGQKRASGFGYHFCFGCTIISIVLGVFGSPLTWWQSIPPLRKTEQFTSYVVLASNGETIVVCPTEYVPFRTETCIYLCSAIQEKFDGKTDAPTF
jgi:hypothetical protein